MSMKCVRTQNAILRLPTAKAQKLVNSGKANYVCKGIWRAWIKELQSLKNNNNQ